MRCHCLGPQKNVSVVIVLYLVSKSSKCCMYMRLAMSMRENYNYLEYCVVCTISPAVYSGGRSSNGLSAPSAYRCCLRYSL